jgi:hypothetical protein
VLRARRTLLLPLVAIALLITACGDEESSSTVTQTETVTESTSSTEKTSSTEETTTTSSDGETPRADITVTKLTGFTSPTGNIGCFIDRSNVRCDIRERDWEPPPAPADCKLDYGQGISLSAGGAPDFVCAGDTALDAGEPLPYGQSISAGLLLCESEQSGMTCRDVETGRGFSIAKQGYELF